jgi:hypothetical protein
MGCDVRMIERFHCFSVACFVMYYHVWKIGRLKVCIGGFRACSP